VELCRDVLRRQTEPGEREEEQTRNGKKAHGYYFVGRPPGGLATFFDGRSRLIGCDPGPGPSRAAYAPAVTPPVAVATGAAGAIDAGRAAEVQSARAA
jgi:hypothetical protein